MLPIHPQAAAELLAHCAVNVKPTDRVLTDVPSMMVMKSDLKFAGIEYGDVQIGFADLHAQRKTLNMLLASAKVDPRTRQSQLRHTDPRLTEMTYFDQEMFLAPQAKAIAAVPPIPKFSGSPTPGMHVSDSFLCNRAGNSRLGGSFRGTDGHTVADANRTDPVRHVSEKR